MKYDPKTYRRRNSYRKADHDYVDNASYFITMCVINKEKCLSNILICEKTKEPIVVLTKYGAIVEQQIKWLRENYEYVKIPSYVIMPDHIHFVIEVYNELKNKCTKRVKPLAQLMGAFKTTCSKYVRLAGKEDFTWQRNYFDNIITSEQMYNNILRYIDRNPKNWNVKYGRKLSRQG